MIDQSYLAIGLALFLALFFWFFIGRWIWKLIKMD